MELIELQDNDLAEFKNLMQESFQYGYERVYGKSNEPILSEKEIDECLEKGINHPMADEEMFRFEKIMKR